MAKTVRYVNPRETAIRLLDGRPFKDLDDLYRRLQDVTWVDKNGRTWNALSGFGNSLAPEHRDNLIDWIYVRAEPLFAFHLMLNTMRVLSMTNIRWNGWVEPVEVPATAEAWLEETPLMKALLRGQQTAPICDTDEPWIIW